MKTLNRCLFLSIMLAAVLAVAGWSTPAYADTGLNVDQHSKQDIIDYIDNSDINFNEDDIYITEPVKDTVRGELSDTTKSHALALLNTYRYIAGLDPVELDEAYENWAQAAAFVNLSLFQMTHYPADIAEKPADMSQEDWEDGIYGAARCNLAMGYTMASAPMAWMDDDNTYNIERVGHRRWCLNPKMKKTGFGAADPYTAMYSIDSSGSGTQSNVSWPAANMPVEYFWVTTPWSLSTEADIDKAKVKVTLTRERDGKVWTFDGANDYSEADTLYFNVDNMNYGGSGAIIFRPDDVGDYYDGDVFHVEITGAGDDVISYTVNFFELSHTLEYIPKRSATTTSEGNIEYWYCGKCGKYFSDVKTTKEITLADTVIPKLPPEAASADEEKTVSGGETAADEKSGDTSAGASTAAAVKVGDSVKKTQGTVKITSTKNRTVAFTKAKNKASVVVPATVKINNKTYKVTQINAKAFTGSKIKTVTIGKNVKTIKKNAFKGSKATKIVLKTKLLKKAKVKGCLKGSKIKTVQVNVSSKKSVNKKYVKLYKKYFTKKNAGRKVTVK